MLKWGKYIDELGRECWQASSCIYSSDQPAFWRYREFLAGDFPCWEDASDEPLTNMARSEGGYGIWFDAEDAESAMEELDELLREE